MSDGRKRCQMRGCGNLLPRDANARQYCQTCMTRRVGVLDALQEFERMARGWAATTLRRERMAYLRRSLARRKVLEVLAEVGA